MSNFSSNNTLEEQVGDAKFQTESTEGPFLLTKPSPNRNGSIRKSGEWTLSENAKYAAFIQWGVQRMQGKPHVQLWSLYKEMEKFVESRNFRQCKSHHQKLVLGFGSISQIISHLITIDAQFETLFNLERKNLSSFMEHRNEKKIQAEPVYLKEMNYRQEPTDLDYSQEIETQNKPGISLPSLSNGMKGDSKLQEWHNLFRRMTIQHVMPIQI